MKTSLRSFARRLYREARRRSVEWLTIGHRPHSHLYYIVEGSDWSISHDGRFIVDGVRRAAGVPARVFRSPLGLRQQVVHFGSRNLYLLGGYCDLDPSNRAIMTWFHGSPDDPNPENRAMIAALPERVQALCNVTTASTIARDRLIGWGVPEEKIAHIPIGVDTQSFRPPSQAARAAVRAELGLGEKHVCLGLFHKDGEGWGEGLNPKWVKAPDVFLQVVERLKSRCPLFVLLTGPARGFVMQGLRRLGVPYRHVRLARQADIVRYYHALDLYVVPSREEGGPKALLECLATGVPLVSTRVGMCADVIRPGENGFLTDVDDAEGLAAAASELIESPALRSAFAEHGLADVRRFDWPIVSRQYYERLYKPLLTT